MSDMSITVIYHGMSLTVLYSGIYGDVTLEKKSFCCCIKYWWNCLISWFFMDIHICDEA